ncbi:STAS/SEC14 domain-containing protein [Granulosicoccaceae sp. 1_MG-2023]|nr:STAS/SEC14 domain-containing protein [Granulosicoccaceae sp. 1_MG-2023]
MSIEKHGLHVGLERVGNDISLSIKAVGKLTHEDYALMTPMIDSATAAVSDPQVRALVDITELQGWELRAAWDDLRIGLRHGSEFVKVAIVGHKSWQSLAAKVGSWFIAGEIRSFDNVAEAEAWLRS